MAQGARRAVASASPGGIYRVPSKRRKIPPQRINEPARPWAERLLAGERPATDDWIGWVYFDGPTPGLPPAGSGARMRFDPGLGDTATGPFLYPNPTRPPAAFPTVRLIKIKALSGDLW
jgi:hypothetical protein